MFEDMDGRIELILDGGDCEVGVESTVLDMTGPVPRILRPGGVTRERIAEICGDCEVDPAVMRPLAEGEQARSPGMKYRPLRPARPAHHLSRRARSAWPKPSARPMIARFRRVAAR